MTLYEHKTYIYYRVPFPWWTKMNLQSSVSHVLTYSFVCFFLCCAQGVRRVTHHMPHVWSLRHIPSNAKFSWPLGNNNVNFVKKAGPPSEEERETAVHIHS